MQPDKANQRGFATLWILFATIPILGMLGLVTDVGWYYFTTEQARTAAEAASLAAIQSAMDSVTAGGSYSCGSGTLYCQAAPAGCATSVPATITSNLQDGCAYAIANGFTNTGAQTVTMQSNVTASPPTVPGVSVTYWVTVRITQSNPLTFLGVFGGSTLGIGVRSTSAVVPVTSTACIVALSPTASPAITISGGSTSVTANNCGVDVASSSSNAINVSGGATLTASSVDVVGGAKTSGGSTITPAVTTVPSVANPYSGVAAPTGFSTTCDALHTNYTVPSGGATISQGTYCGGINNAGRNLTMNAGTYILLGGGFTSSGSSAVTTGSGVFLYNTCTSGLCAGTTTGYQPFVLSGGGSMTLTAATSGAYAGILLLQDPKIKSGGSGQETISGGSTTCFTGVIDVPASDLVYSGGSSAGGCDTALVANTMTFSGGSSLGSSSGSGSGPSAPTAVLIE